jgi:transcription initiation factor TFIIIB Brf1 subunit/transcription initiation factor TFIIB
MSIRIWWKCPKCWNCMYFGDSYIPEKFICSDCGTVHSGHFVLEDIEKVKNDNRQRDKGSI